MKKILIIIALALIMSTNAFGQSMQQLVPTKMYSANSSVEVAGCIDVADDNRYVMIATTDMTRPAPDSKVTIEFTNGLGHIRLVDATFVGIEQKETVASSESFQSKYVVAEDTEMMNFLSTDVKELCIMHNGIASAKYKFKGGKFSSAFVAAMKEMDNLHPESPLEIETSTTEVTHEPQVTQPVLVTSHTKDQPFTIDRVDMLQYQMKESGKYLRRSGNCRWAAVGLGVFAGINEIVANVADNDGTVVACSVLATLSGLSAIALELCSIQYTCKAGKTLQVSPLGMKFNF